MADSQLLQLMLPYGRGFAITTSDTVNFTTVPCRGIYVGGAGNMVVLMNDGQTITLNGVTAGTIYALRAKRVNATSTTATNLVALY